MSTLVVTIGGAPADRVVERSLRIEDRINSRSTADLTILSAGPTSQALDAIDIQMDGVRAFSGYVWAPEISWLNGVDESAGLKVSVPCVDQHLLADRRLVADVFENMTAGAIARAVMATYLAPLGVHEDLIQEGPMISRAVFSYVKTSAVFDELVSLAPGFVWQVSYDKGFTFASRAAVLAPWNIDSSTDGIREASLRRSREQYRNRQIIRGGYDSTDPLTQSFKGDGSASSFALAWPVAEAPTVTVNGIAKTVGVRGIDKGKDWYWQKGDSVVSQDSAGVALTTADTLAVVYRGQYPILVSTEDPGGLATLGPFEEIEEMTDLESSDSAIAAANARLQKYLAVAETLTYRTSRPGLRAGQLQAVDLASLGASGQFLISCVRLIDLGNGDYHYQIEAANGDDVGGWAAFFAAMMPQRTYAIRENEVLIRLATLSDATTAPKPADSVTWSTHQFRRCSSILMCSEGLII